MRLVIAIGNFWCIINCYLAMIATAKGRKTSISRQNCRHKLMMRPKTKEKCWNEPRPFVYSIREVVTLAPWNEFGDIPRMSNDIELGVYDWNFTDVGSLSLNIKTDERKRLESRVTWETVPCRDTKIENFRLSIHIFLPEISGRSCACVGCFYAFFMMAAVKRLLISSTHPKILIMAACKVQ